jgi:hypothetical protein
VADWDGDGSPEIFTSLAWEVAGLRANGTQFTYYDWPNGPAGNKTYWGKYQLSNDPAIGDIDNDGHLELVIASVAAEGDPSHSGIIVYESPSPGGETPWPMLGGNAQHTHLYPRDVAYDARIISHTIPAVMLPDISYDVEIAVLNSGTEAWTSQGGSQLVEVSGSSPLPLQSMLSLESGEQVSPGASKIFSVQMQAPQPPGYYTTEWRMSKSGQQFGTRVQMEVKVGNDPALYVLARDKTRSADGTGVYPVGLAEPMPAPLDAATYTWSDAAAFGVLPDASGYHVIARKGFTTWSAGVGVLGVLSYSPGGLWASLGMLPDGTGFYAIDRNGKLERTDGAAPLSLTGLPAGLVQNLTVTPDGKGILVIDRRGRVYRAGSAPDLPLPGPLPFPENEAIARRIKMTSDGKGYYILDDYGRLWTSGTAVSLTPNYTLHIGEDWARDFELTKDGQGYYLLDKYGNIHTGGDAQPVTVNLPPTWGSDQAVDLALVDSRVAQVPCLTSSGSTVSMIMEYGGALPSQQVDLWKEGGGSELVWEAVESPLASWLHVSPVSGTTPSDLILSVVEALPVGTNSTSLEFEATDLEGNPVDAGSVQIVLHTQNPVLAVSRKMKDTVGVLGANPDEAASLPSRNQKGRSHPDNSCSMCKDLLG